VERAKTITPLNVGDHVEFHVVASRGRGRPPYADGIRRTAAIPKPRRRGIVNSLRPNKYGLRRGARARAIPGARPLILPGRCRFRLVRGSSGFITVAGMEKGVFFPLSEFRHPTHTLAEGDAVRPLCQASAVSAEGAHLHQRRRLGCGWRCQVEFTYVENVQSLPIAVDLQLIERPVRGQKVGGRQHARHRARRR